MFVGFWVLSIICIPSIERRYYDNDGCSLVNTCTVPKLGFQEGPLDGRCPSYGGVCYLTPSFESTQVKHFSHSCGGLSALNKGVRTILSIQY